MDQQQNSTIERFEENLQRLETLVTTLESQELSLDVSLKSFEEGIKLAQLCEKQLKDARQNVEILIADGENLNSEPFDIETDS